MNEQATWLYQVNAPSATFFDICTGLVQGGLAGSILPSLGIVLLISHHCSLPDRLCSLPGLKFIFTATSSTSDGLPGLGEKNQNEQQK